MKRFPLDIVVLFNLLTTSMLFTLILALVILENIAFVVVLDVITVFAKVLLVVIKFEEVKELLTLIFDATILAALRLVDCALLKDISLRPKLPLIVKLLTA